MLPKVSLNNFERVLSWLIRMGCRITGSHVSEMKLRLIESRDQPDSNGTTFIESRVLHLIM